MFDHQAIANALHCPLEDEATEASMDEVIAEITDGMHTAWPSAIEFAASDVSRVHTVLHKLAFQNWIPTTHTTAVNKPMAVVLFKVGRGKSIGLPALMFKQILKHAEVKSRFGSLHFPSLICNVLLSQNQELKDPSWPVKSPKEFNISLKFTPLHVHPERSLPLQTALDADPTDATTTRHDEVTISSSLTPRFASFTDTAPL